MPIRGITAAESAAVIPRIGGGPGRPSLDLLRQLSDANVLGAVLDEGPGSRADLAARTGLSKPTVSQAVGRLIDAGVLAEAGRAEHSGRGRAGTVVTLADGSPCALVLRAGGAGLLGEVVRADGEVLAREERTFDLPVSARRLSSALRHLAASLADQAPGGIAAVGVSIANPVDRQGRTVNLPGSPFLAGGLDVGAAVGLTLAPLVDNDVNWALLAEHRLGAASGCTHVVQVHLGVGLGAAILTEGTLVRGSRGFAGEITHAVTDPAAARRAGAAAGRRHDPLAGSLLGQLSELGLLSPGAVGVDLTRVQAALDRGGDKAQRLLEAITATVRGACHLLDPEVVVLDGPWGRHPRVVEAVRSALGADEVVEADVRVARLDDGPLAGARLGALDALRAALIPA
ncbi:MAG: ROK family transcriptional regulator [Dermatophilaceae bacterium]|jgi:predicted NBD/HSP70 family sugar kinase